MTDITRFNTVLTASPLLITGRLLDNTRTIGDEKVALAVSVRKTSTNYRGPAMRVRRTSDNSQKDIGFLESDLDVPALLNFVSGFDAYVTIWYDQSGQGNHVYQDDWSLQPQIVKQGQVIVDVASNRPTVRFEGASMTSDWEIQGNAEIQSSSIAAVASTGILTYDDDRDRIALIGRQPGSIKTYDLGTELVTPDYPNNKLPEGYDTFALESHTTYDGNLVYANGSTYYSVTVDPDDPANLVTVSDTGVSVRSGPGVLTASKVLPRFPADDSLVFPTDNANDAYLDGVVGTNGNIYYVPWNSEYIMELDEDGGIDPDTGDQVASAQPLLYSNNAVIDLGSQSGKYFAGIGHTDGIYCIPYNATNVLYIDTTASPVTHELLFSGNTLFPGNGAFRSAQQVGNDIYCVPYNADQVVKITLSGNTSTATAIGPSIPGNYKFYTSCLRPDTGLIVAPPYYAGSILTIDTTTANVSLVGSTGGYFVTDNQGRGYPLATKTVNVDAQNSGNPAQGTVPINTSSILTAVDVENVDENDDPINFGYYETPSVRIITGVFTYRNPSVNLVMADVDPSDPEKGQKVDRIDITDAGDNVRGCTLQLIGGFGETAKARSFVSIQPNTGYGVVTAASITNDGGSGYLAYLDPTDSSEWPQVQVSGGRLRDGTDATIKVSEISPLSEGGRILLLEVVDGGSKYVSPPALRIVGGKGKPPIVTTRLNGDGRLARLAITNGGSGYAPGTNEASIFGLGNDALNEAAYFEAYKTYMASGGATNTFPGGYIPKIQIQIPYDAYIEDEDDEGNVIRTRRGNPRGATGATTGIGSWPGACAYIKNVDAGGSITEIGMISTGSGYIKQPTVTVDGNATLTPEFIVDGVLDLHPNLVDPGTLYTQNTSATIQGTRSSYAEVDDSAIPGGQGSVSFNLEGEVPDPDGGPVQDYVYRTSLTGRRFGEYKFISCVYDADSTRVYVAPWVTHRFVSIETQGDTIGRPRQILGNLGTGFGKISDIVRAKPAGQSSMCYCIPYNWEYVPTISGTPGTVQYIQTFGGTNKRFSGQWNKGILYDLNNNGGVIYGIPSNENSLLVIDGKRDTDGTYLHYLSTTEYFGNMRGRGDKFSSAVIGASDLIYFVNKDANFIVEFNTGQSALRKTSINDVIVFPTANINTSNNIVAVSPKDFLTQTYLDNNSLDPITFADGLELPNGNVVFVPTYSVSDPYPYKGKILEIKPSTNTFSLHGNAVPVYQTPPFPSRCAALQGNLVTWVPRGPSSNASNNEAIMVWDPATPVQSPTSFGLRPESQAEVRWATQVAVTDSTTCGCIPSETTVSQESNVFDSSYFSSSDVWRFADAVVDPYQRIFLVPATVTRESQVGILYPTDPSKNNGQNVSTEFNIGNSPFPLFGEDLGNVQLQFPTTIKLDSTLWEGWGPPDLSWSGDESAIAYGGAVLSGYDQKIYCVPFNAPDGLVIDPVYCSHVPLGQFRLYEDSAVTRTRIDINNNAIVYAQQMYRGLVEGANNKMYGIPYGANNVCEIDPTLEDVAVRSDFLPQLVSNTAGFTSQAGFEYDIFQQDQNGQGGYFEYYGPTFFDGQGNPSKSGLVTDMTSISSATEGASYSVPFSVKWKGIIQAPSTGTYTFSTTSDDASYLWVLSDPNTILEFDTALVKNGGTHGPETKSATITLTANQYYTVVIMYGTSSSNGSGSFSASITVPSGSATTDWSSVLVIPAGGINYNAKWWGGVRARNNKIYCAPFNADCVLVISPGEGTTPTSISIPTTLTGLGRGGNKWANGVITETGVIYFCPVSSPNILKIVPGENGESDQMTLIPFFSGTAKFWSGVYSPIDKFIYFFPGLQTTGGYMVKFDTISESYERIGQEFNSSDYRYPGRLVTRPAILPTGESYVFPGRGFNDPVKLELGQTQIFETDRTIQTGDNDKYIRGRGILHDFKLRPYLVEYPVERESYVLFHTDNTYALFNPNADTNVKPIVPLTMGPRLRNGVSGLLTDRSGTFVSIYKAITSVASLFQGGLAGVRSPMNTADLAMVVKEPSLVSFVGDSETEIRNIFRTIFRQGNLGVFASLGSTTTIQHFIRESAVLQTNAYNVSGGVDGRFGIGQVDGFADVQLTCPNVSRISSVSASTGNATNAFDTNITSVWQSTDGTYASLTGDATGTEQYVEVVFSQPARIGSFEISSAADDLSTMPRQVTLQAKNTGDPSWTDIETFGGIERTQYKTFQRKLFELSSCGYFDQYRLEVNRVFPTASRAELAEVVLYGRFQPSPGSNPPSYTSRFAGHISEIVALSQTNQQKAGYGADQVFYFNFSSSPYVNSSNSTID